MILYDVQRNSDQATTRLGVNQILKPGTVLRSLRTGETIQILRQREATAQEIAIYERELNMTDDKRAERDRVWQEACDAMERAEQEMFDK